MDVNSDALPKVLVIDDEPDVREMISDILHDEHIDVTQAANGQEALDLLKGGYRPTLILCDLSMPVMSGADFQRQLNALNISVAVCIVSAHSEEFKIIESMQLGAIDYFIKPFSSEDFLKKIYLLLEIGKKRLAQPELGQMLRAERLLRLKNSMVSGKD